MTRKKLYKEVYETYKRSVVIGKNGKRAMSFYSWLKIIGLL